MWLNASHMRNIYRGGEGGKKRTAEGLPNGCSANLCEKSLFTPDVKSG
jgi:hypothetical protein